MDVRVVNVRKKFDLYPALHDVSLDVRSGELIALLGPSGSGKTTLLRLIAGLEQPDAGAIFFGEENASGKTVQERKVGFVFQHYALFRHMSVAENIGFGLKVRPRGQRPSRAQIRKRAAELLALVQLPGLGERYPAQLSGGQRQRVAFARALAVEPNVLLLDEPFGALDAKVRKDLRRWLREMHERTGHTTVFVTHDQEEALELADRVAILNEGKLEQVGTADEVYDEPASPFVMSFLGDTASIPVAFDGRHYCYEGQAFVPPLAGPYRGDGRLYLRPRDIEIAAPGTAHLLGKATAIRRTASGRRLQVALGQSGATIEVEPDRSAGVAPGDLVGLRIRSGRIFPAETDTTPAAKRKGTSMLNRNPSLALP